jgi:hypothetical protein
MVARFIADSITPTGAFGEYGDDGYLDEVGEGIVLRILTRRRLAVGTLGRYATYATLLTFPSEPE